MTTQFPPSTGTAPDPELVAALRADEAANGPVDVTTPEGRARQADLDEQWHARHAATEEIVDSAGHVLARLTDTADDEPPLHALPQILAPGATVTLLPIGPQPLRCGCGSEWFRLAARPGDPPAAAHGALAFTSEGSVRAYAGEPVCIECGDTQVIV